MVDRWECRNISVVLDYRGPPFIGFSYSSSMCPQVTLMALQIGELNSPRMRYTEPFRMITCIDFTPAERKNQLHLVTKSTQIPKHNSSLRVPNASTGEC